MSSACSETEGCGGLFGKTFAMRVLALVAALDPLVELRVFELKGTGDLQVVEGARGRWRMFTLIGDNAATKARHHHLSKYVDGGPSLPLARGQSLADASSWR